MTALQIQTPRAFLPLLAPRRFKGASGGRGGAKSHFFAEMLIDHILSHHVRAVCLREIQLSIKDSVKQLIEDKIHKFSLEHLFNITDKEIRGPNDGLVIFRGLQTHTSASIKSLEGFNRALYEEGQTLSKRSLDIAIPTFRAPGTEQWFAWNPDSEKDPVDRHFRQNAGDNDFVHVHVNYYDNPWFPDDLRADMERDKLRDPDKYSHVWLGGYRKKSEARVFQNYRIENFETPANVRFYFGADFGFSIDPTVLIRCFIVGRTLYIDREAWSTQCPHDRIPSLFDKVPGSRNNIITADSSNPGAIEYLQTHGFQRVRPSIKGTGSVEDGVEYLRSYDVVIHKDNCPHVADEFGLYSWKMDKAGDITNVLEDKKNHTIDSVRYALENLRRVGGSGSEEVLF